MVVGELTSFPDKKADEINEAVAQVCKNDVFSIAAIAVCFIATSTFFLNKNLSLFLVSLVLMFSFVGLGVKRESKKETLFNKFMGFRFFKMKSVKTHKKDHWRFNPLRYVYSSGGLNVISRLRTLPAPSGEQTIDAPLQESPLVDA